jgi:hypothetical protein
VQPASQVTQPVVGTQQATPAGLVGTVTGRVTNETAGGKVPPGLPVGLQVVDADSNVTNLSTTVDADGNYTFKDVPIRAGWIYVVDANYEERPFGNALALSDTASTTITLPIKLYELTDQPDVLTITSLVTRVNAAPDGLQVAQIVRLQNKTDKAYSTNQTLSDKRHVSVSLPLPHGAVVTGFADSEQRYALSSDGSTVLDTYPVLPGVEHVLHVIYSLPYRDGMTIEQTLSYAVDGTVQVYVSPESIYATGSQWTSQGLQDQSGTTVHAYGGPTKLNAGQSISYQLHGAVSAAASTSTPGGAISKDLVIGLLLGSGAAIFLVGVVFLIRSRVIKSQTSSANQQGRIDDLVDQIADLDELRTNRQIGKSAYERQRRKLKAQLAALMKDKT